MNDLFILYGVDLSPEEMKEKTGEMNVDSEIDESDLEALIIRRVEKLSNLVKDQYEIIDDDADDVIAHLALRMISASDQSGRVETWFINNECAALRNKLVQIRNNNRTSFMDLLKRLLFTDILEPLDDFCYYSEINERRISKRIGVRVSESYLVLDWKAIPRAIHGDKAILYDGYAIINFYDPIIISQATRNFELLLRSKIYGLASKMTVDTVNYYNRMGEKLLDVIQSTSTTFIGLEHLEEETKCFPPCMRAVDLYISKGMELERSELLQMGFFLREAGMNLNDYKRYWYLRHPSNAGKSYEEFESSHWGRYELPHHYGEIGGGKKYKSMACKKIQSEGLCPFKDWLTEQLFAFIRPHLDEIYISDEEKMVLERRLNHVKRMCNKRFFGAACSTEFELRFKTENHPYVNHPIHTYFAQAKMLARERNKKEEDSDDESSD